jgi:hypothetical protein
MLGIFRISANVVSTSWLNDADRVSKVLNSPLEDYSSLMTAERLANFVKARKHRHGSTWYSKNMTSDAAVYIMSWSSIEAGRITLSKEMARDARAGHPWSDVDIERKTEKMIKDACKVWETRLPKLATVVNEANGPDFLPRCREIHQLSVTDN